MVLKGQVERGSGHFSKVRALAGAIRHIEKLMEKVKCLANQTMKNALSSLHGPQLEVYYYYIIMWVYIYILQLSPAPLKVNVVFEVWN